MYVKAFEIFFFNASCQTYNLLSVLLVSSPDHSTCSLHMEREASIYWKLTTIPSPRFIQVDSCSSDEFAVEPLMLSYQVVSLDWLL